MPPNHLQQIIDKIDEQVQLSVRRISPGPINRPSPATVRTGPPCRVHPDRIAGRHGVCDSCVGRVARCLQNLQTGGAIPKHGTRTRAAILTMTVQGTRWRWSRELATLQATLRGDGTLTCGGCGGRALREVPCAICSGTTTDADGDASTLLCDGCGCATAPRSLTMTPTMGAVCLACVETTLATMRAA